MYANKVQIILNVNYMQTLYNGTFFLGKKSDTLETVKGFN